MTRKNVQLDSLVSHQIKRFQESSFFFMARKIPLVNISQLMAHPNLKKRKLEACMNPAGSLKMFAQLNEIVFEYLRLLFEPESAPEFENVFIPFNLTWFIQSEELKLLKLGLLKGRSPEYPRRTWIINFDEVKGFETLIDRKIRLYDAEFNDGRWIFGKNRNLSEENEDLEQFYQKYKIKSIFSMMKALTTTE